MKNFNGEILFLNRDDINTDEIIPARYLTEITKAALRPHLLEDLELEGFDPKRDTAGKRAIVAGENFGCGSSREHAPWALEENGINVVIAPSFARIFRGNMYNCGMLAVELPREQIDALFKTFRDTTTAVEVDWEQSMLRFSADKVKQEYSFAVSDFDRALVEAGGWLEFADSRY